MGIKIYRKMMKDEFVYQDEATEYALDQLGITMKPKGKDGEYTLEQYDFIKEFTDWYYSGEWVEDELPEDNGKEDEWAVKQDMIYEQNLEKRLLEK